MAAKYLPASLAAIDHRNTYSCSKSFVLPSMAAVSDYSYDAKNYDDKMAELCVATEQASNKLHELDHSGLALSVCHAQASGRRRVLERLERVFRFIRSDGAP